MGLTQLCELLYGPWIILHSGGGENSRDENYDVDLVHLSDSLQSKTEDGLFLDPCFTLPTDVWKTEQGVFP